MGEINLFSLESRTEVNEKASRKFGDFKLHCMMDEIGKFHPTNVKGILCHSQIAAIFCL